MKLFLATTLLVVTTSTAQFVPRSYHCDEYKRCVQSKDSEKGDEFNISLGECKLTCGDDVPILPLPRKAKAAKTVAQFHPDEIEFSNKDELQGSPTAQLLEEGLKEQIDWLQKKRFSPKPANLGGSVFSIKFEVRNGKNSEPPIIRKSTNESYSLSISYDDNSKTIAVTIRADNYFGARHGLESLFQLAQYDDLKSSFIVLNNVEISDRPEFRHRGLTLDTSRSFIRVDVIRRIIDGLAHSKLNVLHWHIVDTHSFPVELKQDPINLMSQYGAYDADSIYSQEDIMGIVKYANFRGVRVIPEFDQPAHVGHGWEFPGAEDYTLCFNKEPWYKYCYEPPCGQLNPLVPAVYDILEKIYDEFYDVFQFDSFHMGADEVKFECWNVSDPITNYLEDNQLDRKDAKNFVKLWSDFQFHSSQRLFDVVKKKNPNLDLEVIVWTSHLTKEENIDNLPNDKYAIQIWSNGTDFNDTQIKILAEKGYNMIFSNYDALYLDCGYGAWVGEGNNWCSPYKGWQKIYENDPYDLLEKRGVKLTDAKKKLVLGGEVAMWTEQVDSETVEGKIFPRASALAERLWSNPQSEWYKAEQRMLDHRLTITQRGVRADALQPEWCRQNTWHCYSGKYSPFNEDAEK